MRRRVSCFTRAVHPLTRGESFPFLVSLIFWIRNSLASSLQPDFVVVPRVSIVHPSGGSGIMGWGFRESWRAVGFCRSCLS